MAAAVRCGQCDGRSGPFGDNEEMASFQLCHVRPVPRRPCSAIGQLTTRRDGFLQVGWIWIGNLDLCVTKVCADLLDDAALFLTVTPTGGQHHRR